MTAAFLDAGVLYPILLCDTLLRLAEAGAYVPRWSETILAEFKRNLSARIGDARAERRVGQMRAAFPEAAVTGYEPLVGEMTNHPKDRHVLAAAVVARATFIGTENLGDFPPESVAPHRIRVISAGEFLVRLFDVDPILFRTVLGYQAASYRNPPFDVRRLVDELAVHAPGIQARLAAKPT
jgi:hypothetical protein